MSHNTQHNRRPAPSAWSSRIELTSLDPQNDGINNAPKHTSRKSGSSKIEKEIIWAVVALYAGIIACFAGLHLYGLTLS